MRVLKKKLSYPRPDAYSQPSKSPGTSSQDKLFIYTKARSIYPAEKPVQDEADSRFSLDQKLLLLSTPPPTLIQNLDFCLGVRQWDKAAPRDDVCKGNPSLFNPGMHSVRDSISPHISYLSHSWTPTVKAERKTAGTPCSSITDLGCYSSLTWAPTWARGRTPHENSLPIVRISPRANLTFWSIDLGSHCSPCFPPPLPPHVGSEVII